MPSKPLEVYDDTIAVGDTIRAFGNATGTVLEVNQREDASPMITYEAVYDVPALKAKAGQVLHCDIRYCRKVV